MNKSIAYAGWSQFIDILSLKAERAGCKVIKVDTKGTSQHCSNGLNIVPKTLDERWHSCSEGGCLIDRETKAATVIKKVGWDITLLKNARKRSLRYTACG
jgi:putative transposase